MGTIFTIIVATCLLIAASIFLLPVLLILAVVGLVLFGLFAGVGVVFWGLIAVAVVVAAVVLMHLAVPLLIAALMIWGLVYVIKQLSTALS
jgi:hypothetical protein